MATVLIAKPEHLPAFGARADLGEIIAFAESDVLQALEAITSLRPAMVVLESVFAETSRGTALINRIKADQALKECVIRVLSHDGRGESTQEALASLPPLDITGQPPSPLDWKGTRKAERFPIADGVELFIEGTPVKLVNMSLTGAQVLSPTVLKPNQRIRFSLTNEPGALRFRGVIAWAQFEIPKGTPAYRAGIEMFGVDDATEIAKFIDAKKKKEPDREKDKPKDKGKKK